MSAKEAIIGVLREHERTLLGTATADGLDAPLLDAIAIAILLKIEIYFRGEGAKGDCLTLEGDMLMAALKGLSLTNADQERTAFFYELHSRLKAREEKKGVKP